MIKLKKRKGKTKMWIIIVVIVAVLGIAALGGILVDAPGRHEIEKLTFSNVKFKNLRNGTFIGKYVGKKAHLRDVKLEMTVSGGEIKYIKILKGAVGKDGKPIVVRHGLSVDNLFNRAVQSQTLDVDVISGATLTSKAHLKALENALEQAQAK